MTARIHTLLGEAIGTVDFGKVTEYVEALERVINAARNAHVRMTSGEGPEYLLRDALANLDALRGGES